MDAPTPESYPVALDEPATAAVFARGRKVVWVCLALLPCLLILSVASFVTAGRQAAELLRVGTKVPGQVARVGEGAKGAPYISVSYSYAGVDHTRTVSVGSTSSYRPGDHVTVVVDPDRPSRIRTTTEPNESPGLTVLGALSAGFAFAPGMLGLVGLSARGTRRRCATGRWVPVERQEVRRGRRLGFVLSGQGLDVTVFPRRTSLLGPLWLLSDATPGHPVIVRVQRDARWGGPLRIATLRTWA